MNVKDDQKSTLPHPLASLSSYRGELSIPRAGLSPAGTETTGAY